MTVEAGQPAIRASGTEKLRVLLVDDEPKNLTALESILETEDLELVRAESGFEALKHLLDGDFALIILDVHMPGMDGFETAEFIRERERSHHTPIIFLTAAVRGEFAMSKGYGLGAVDYIVKPIDADILRFKVAVFADLFRKTAEAQRHADALADAHAFLSGVLDGATENTIAALDGDGRVLVWNEGGRRMYGRPSESMIGQHVRRLFAEEEHGTLESMFACADREGGVREDMQHVRANGRTFPARVTLTRRVLPGGTQSGYVLITADITERRQAELMQLQLAGERASRAAAETEQHRLQQLLDVLPESVIVTDAAGRVERLNATARAMIGDLPAGTDLMHAGRLGAWQRLQADGSPFPAGRLALPQAVLVPQSVQQEQELLRNPQTGAEVPVLTNVAPILDAGGAVSGGVMVLQDISTLKDLERQKDEFLAAVSHDLRSPLTIIAGKAQLLSRRTSRLGTEEAAFFNDFLRSIDRTAKRAAGMVNGLMDVARMQMNRPLQLERSQVDLATVVANVASDLQATTAGHRIATEVQESPILGLWDGPRLERVAVNLIENAIKYSPDGGIVTVRTWLAEDDSGRRSAVFSVADRGVGIAADELTHVFGRFYRARNAIGKIEGSGIGLAVVKKVVEEHGGEISLESEEGVGTTVTVRLPMEPLPGGSGSVGA